MAFIISPTAIIVIDSSVDISMFYDVNEEKEEKVNEKNIEIESLFDEIEEKDVNFTINIAQNNVDYFLKKYSKPHLNFASPPPDIQVS